MHDRFNRARDLFDQLIAVTPGEWPQRLQAAAPDDAALRMDVLALLRHAHAHAVEQPASTAGESDSDPNIGRSVGAFRLTRLIGHGGMGNVYLGERRDGFKQQVAIKLVRRGFDTDDVLRRFRLERQVLAQLNHPHIARLVDGGETSDGSPYFAMEYVDEALPITEYCDRRRMPNRERMRLFAQVCRAVHAAHQNTVLHRDLKPGNILVDRTGAPKLVDFGIAKLLAADAPDATKASSAAAGFAPMTPEYASPEQFLGQLVTTASDIYSLGVVLYELLVGQRPYDGAKRVNLDALQRAVVASPPVPPSQRLNQAIADNNGRRDTGTSEQCLTLEAARGSTLRDMRRQFSRELETLVLYPLNKETQLRYKSAEAFAEDIERFLRGEGVHAVPATVRYRMATFVRCNKALVGGIAATFLAVLAGALTSFSLYLRAEQSAVAATRESAKWRSSAAVIDRTFANVSYGDQLREPRLSDVLGQLSREAKRVAIDQPEVAAQVFTSLGVNYQMSDRFDEARTAFQQAADLLAPTLGSNHPEVAILLARIGIVDISRNQLSSATSLIEDAVSVLRSHRDAHPDYLAEALIALAQIRTMSGVDREACESICREAISLVSDSNQDHLDERASAWLVLADIARLHDDFETAIAHTRVALPLCQAAFGEYGNYTLSVTNNLAYLLTESHQEREAKQLYLDMVPRAREKLADDPAKLVVFLNFSARAFDYKLGEPAIAASLYQEALSIAEAKLGNNHVLTAEAELQAALRMQKSEGGALPEAADRIRPALQVLERELGEDHPTVLMAQFSFVVALFQRNQNVAQPNLGDIQEARGVGESLLTQLERLGPRPDIFVSVGEVLDELARIYDALDLDAPRARECAQHYANRFAGDDSSFGSVMARLTLVNALTRAGQLVAAEDLYSSVAKAAKQHADNAHLVAHLSYALALLRAEQGRFAEAEAALIEADKWIRSDPNNAERPELMGIRRNLVKLYESWNAAEPGAGYDAKAASLREVNTAE